MEGAAEAAGGTRVVRSKNLANNLAKNQLAKKQPAKNQTVDLQSEKRQKKKPIRSDNDGDDDEENRKRQVADPHGGFHIVYAPPGDDEFQPDAGIGCLNPESVRASHGQAAQDAWDREQRADESEGMQAAIENESFPSIECRIPLHLIRDNDKSVSETFEYACKHGDVAASAKLFLIKKFKKQCDVLLYRDSAFEHQVDDKMLLSSFEEVYVEKRQISTDDENSWVLKDKIKVLEQAVKVGKNGFFISPDDRSELSVFTGQYQSKSIVGKALDPDALKIDLIDHFSYLLSETMINRFFDTNDVLGKIASLVATDWMGDCNYRRLTAEQRDALLDDVYPHMLSRISFPALFAFIDEVADSRLLACLTRSIVTSVFGERESNDIRTERHVEEKNDDVDEQKGLSDEERCDDENDACDEDEEPQDEKSIMLPWELQNYTKDEIVRFAKVAKVLMSFYKFTNGQHNSKKSWLFRNLLSNFKHRAPQELLDKIYEKSVKFTFSATSRSSKALHFLFCNFFTTMKQKRTGNDRRDHVIAIDGWPSLMLNKIHVNGGDDELAEECDVIVTAHPGKKICVADSPVENNEEFLVKEVGLPFLPRWPSQAIGLISQSLPNNLFVVQLLSPDADIRLGVWKHTETSDVRLCSMDASFNNNSCLKCNRVKFTERCFCQVVEVNEIRPFYVVSYGKERFPIRFVEGQVVKVHLSPLSKVRADCRSAKATLMYIEEITGSILTLRGCFGQMRSVIKKIHFLSEYISVHLCGDGPLNTLRYYYFFTPSLTTASGYTGSWQTNVPQSQVTLCFVAPITENVCTCCGRGPKSFFHGCNFCGSFEVGVEQSSDFSPSVKHLPLSVKAYCSKLNGMWKEFNKAFSKETNEITTRREAVQIHDKLRQSVSHHLGAVVFTRGDDVVCGEYEFVKWLHEADDMKLQLDFAEETMKVHFSKRLCTWVQDDAPKWLLALRDEEMKQFEKKPNAKRFLGNMRVSNRIVSQDLQKAVADKILECPFFPLSGITHPLDHTCAIHEPPVTVNMAGETFKVSFAFSLKRKFVRCSCKVFPNTTYTCQHLSFLDGGKATLPAYIRDGTLYCAGPFMGISCSRFDEAMWLIQHLGGHIEGCEEEVVALRLLQRIHCIFEKHDTSNVRIFNLYVLCMFFYYAFDPAKMYVEKTPIPRGKKSVYPRISDAAVKKLCDEYGSADKINWDAAMDKMHEVIPHKDRHSEKLLTWFERWKTAPHAKFFALFYDEGFQRCGEIFQYARYSGPIPKKGRCNVHDISIPPEEKVALLLQNASTFVLAMMPYNGMKDGERPEVIENKKNAWKGFSRIGLDKMCERFDGNKTDAMQMYRDIWHDFSSLCTHRSECRSKEEFLRILRDFELDRSSFCPTFCANKSCRQCIVVKALDDLNMSRFDVNLRIIKSVVGGNAHFADRQLDIFGKLVSFLVCPHLKYLNECHTCLSSTRACYKDENCPKDKDGVFLCSTKHRVFFHAKNGSFVPYEELGTGCKIIRHCVECSEGKEPDVDNGEEPSSMERARAPLVDEAACAEMNFFEKGFEVKRLFDE